MHDVNKTHRPQSIRTRLEPHPRRWIHALLDEPLIDAKVRNRGRFFQLRLNESPEYYKKTGFAVAHIYIFSIASIWEAFQPNGKL